jgi:4-carboxymuconolactone decarboxylase
VQRLTALKRYVGAALNIGLSPITIQESVIQIGIYAGFTASEEALAVAVNVFKTRGVKADAPPRNESLEELTAQGTRMMLELHREGSAQGYAAPGNAVTGALYPVAIQYGYGAIWFRPGLTHKQRVLLSVASFTSLRLDSQTRKFGQAAMNLGATREEVIEAIIQTAPFSGYAPALNALGLLSEVLRA